MSDDYHKRSGKRRKLSVDHTQQHLFPILALGGKPPAKHSTSPHKRTYHYLSQGSEETPTTPGNAVTLGSGYSPFMRVQKLIHTE